jgi:hypothetical protein
MTGPVTTTTDPAALEVAGIEDALDELLTAAIEADRKPRPTAERVYKVYSITELMDFMEKSKAERDTYDLIKNPVAWVCRRGVRVLGERLYEIGGMDLMTRVLDDVAERDPAHSGYRMGVMDARWDCIGRTGGNPGWCS